MIYRSVILLNVSMLDIVKLHQFRMLMLDMPIINNDFNLTESLDLFQV